MLASRWPFHCYASQKPHRLNHNPEPHANLRLPQPPAPVLQRTPKRLRIQILPQIESYSENRIQPDLQSPAVIDAELRIPAAEAGIARNMNTVAKLAAMAAEAAG